MDALTLQLAELSPAQLRAMISASLAPSPRLVQAHRVALARETTNAQCAAFPGLTWVVL